MLCLCYYKFAKYFSILNDVKIKITHSIAPVNLHLSIASLACPNVFLIVLSSLNLFLEALLQ